MLGQETLVLLVHRLRITGAHHIIDRDDRFPLQSQRNKVIKENGQVIFSMKDLLVRNNRAQLAKADICAKRHKQALFKRHICDGLICVLTHEI